MDNFKQVTQDQAIEIMKSGKNVFLTGYAGTGKSYTLERFKEWCYGNDRNVIVTAPTGIAAINVGGATIHSTLKMFGMYPEHRPIKRQTVDWMFVHTLVIDEISMVGPDFLDEIDFILKQSRNDFRPFGGIQVILVGDPKQLPPVYADNGDSDKAAIAILLNKYGSLKFDKAESYKDFEEIELFEVKRTKDPKLVDLLNRIRDGKISALSEFQHGKGDEKSVHLFPFNNMVDAHNNMELSKIKGDKHEFRGSVSGNFDTKNCITPIILNLKVGARVMVTKNLECGLVNGDLGTVSAIKDNKVFITSDRFEDEFEIAKAEWQQIEYHGVEEEVVGTYLQIPLKLGFALTIHKSQGLTLEHLVVHATKNVSKEMLYVALSRATSFEDLYVRNH